MRRRNGTVPWWLILILILNLLIRIILQEWIIGPAPSAENVRLQAEVRIAEQEVQDE